jgi:hypothetical protein
MFASTQNLPPITIEQARKILGTTAKELSDETIAKIVLQVDTLTDIVVAHVNDSKIHNSLDNSSTGVDNNG